MSQPGQALEEAINRHRAKGESSRAVVDALAAERDDRLGVAVAAKLEGSSTAAPSTEASAA